MITGRSQARIRNRENRNRENRNRENLETHERENQDPYSSPEDHEQYTNMFLRLDRLRRRLDTTMPTTVDTPTPLILDFP